MGGDGGRGDGGGAGGGSAAGGGGGGTARAVSAGGVNPVNACTHKGGFETPARRKPAAVVCSTDGRGRTTAYAGVHDTVNCLI
jgi:hypothetical protein